MKKISLDRHALKPMVAAVAVGIAALSQPVAAVDWNLSDRPMYLGNTVPANLLFVVDDSGSMDWEIISKDAANDGRMTGPQPDGSSSPGDGGIVGRSKCSNIFSYGVEFKSNKSSGACNVAVSNEWRFRNWDYNPFYFNPAKEYKPWAGVDDNNVPFGNVLLSQAWDDVFTKNYTSSGEWIDLGTKGPEKSTSTTGDNHVSLAGGFRFYTWKDDGDKKFENGEQTEYSIGSLSTVPAGWFGSSTDDVKTNFANWFSYYRGREQVAKSAFGRVIANVNGVNMGLMTLHNNNKVATPLKLIDQSAAGETNRAALMRNVYRIDSNNGTPLQQAMKDADLYLANQSPSSASGLTKKTPLTAAQGGECQQNFMVAMTDGFYNGSYSDSGPTIGNADADGPGPFDGGAYADKYDKTLADIAMHYYETDIDTTNANKVPTIKGVDENPAQHVVTFTIAFGVNGTLNGDPTDPTAAFTWPNPTSSDAARVDDLRHAAYNGRGKFLTAQSPDDLVNSLNYMLNSIQARWGSSGGIAFNSGSLRSNSVVFEGRYHSSDWHGELSYFPVNVDGGVGTPIVEAGAILADDKKTDITKRTILSYDPDSGKPIPFQWAALGTSPTWKAALGSEAVANWLRGSHDCEVNSTATCATSKSLRSRTNGTFSFRLGDIVNSGPAYVSSPASLYEFDGYPTFAAKNKNRTPVVYIGANDGMVHGFDASIAADGKPTGTTGNEVLAFIPSALSKKLKSLTEPTYIHQYFVDGAPSVGDAFFGGTWHTVLTGGLRGGGQGVYALDVTDPTQFAEANASDLMLWEFTDKDDADLGYTYSQPNIAKLGNGRFAAVFGNGYNSTIADGKAGSGNAVLFIVDLETKSVVKLDTGVGPSKDPEGKSRANGLSDITLVDVDADRVADYVYAGDLFGNMWRFDVTASDTTSWSVSFGGNPLFTAQSPDKAMQSITARPTITLHPTQSGYMVYFGTGKYLEPSDNTTTGQATQTFYAIWDKSAKEKPVTLVSFSRANLLAQQIVNVDLATGTRVTSDSGIDWATQQGWYMDLIYKGVNGGERVITEPLIRNGIVVFTTMSPDVVVCGSGGSGWVMVLDVTSGSRLATTPFDINDDGQFTSSDLGTTSTSPPGTKASISGIRVTGGIPSAPAVIEGAGGTVDLIAINVSDGHVGGSGSLGKGPKPGTIGSLDRLAKFGIQGRLSWERLK